MLNTLSIRNFAIIEKLDIDFSKGLTVITGETGAGKSIIIEAFSLILGARAEADAIRTGEESALVQATFSIGKNKPLTSALSDIGITQEDGEINVRREISRDGSAKCFINGMKTPLRTLKELGGLLVDMHGQHEHQLLLRPSSHRAYIDDFAGNSSLLEKYKGAYLPWRAAVEELASLDQRTTQLKQQRDFLEHRKKELDQANLSAGLEESLLAKVRRAEGGRKLIDLKEAVAVNLDTDLLKRLAAAEKAALQVSILDPSYSDASQQLSDIRVKISELASRFDAANSEDEIDKAQLEEINNSLARISRLRRKYTSDEAGLIALREQTHADLSLLENTEGERSRLQTAVAGLFKNLQKTGKELSSARKRAAENFDKKITASLKIIHMSGASFVTKIESTETYAPHGCDDLEFLISPNRGEPEKPLARIASGGEMSRVMLAVKSALAEHDRVPVLIFDEIDAGIGGETAVAVAGLLKKLSEYHQIFCVTHLHQLAGEATNHFSVSKQTDKGRTRTAITRLSGDERVDEIARMMGASGSHAARTHARELVEGAA